MAANSKDPLATIMVFGIPHEIQGEKFQFAVDDECYRDTIAQLSSVYKFDYIFEEAAGRGPSHAESFAHEADPEIGYLDVDPSVVDRPKHGLAENTGDSFVVDLWQTPPCTPRMENVDGHLAREEFWLTKIKEQSFRSALFICGIAHSLSMAFRLKSSGYHVENAVQHLPYDKLCSHGRNK